MGKTLFYAVYNCTGILDPDGNDNQPKCPFSDDENGYCAIMERYDSEEDLHLPKDCILLEGEVLVFLADKARRPERKSDGKTDL